MLSSASRHLLRAGTLAVVLAAPPSKTIIGEAPLQRTAEKLSCILHRVVPGYTGRALPHLDCLDVLLKDEVRGAGFSQQSTVHEFFDRADDQGTWDPFARLGRPATSAERARLGEFRSTGKMSWALAKALQAELLQIERTMRGEDLHGEKAQDPLSSAQQELRLRWQTAVTRAVVYAVEYEHGVAFSGENKPPNGKTDRPLPFELVFNVSRGFLNEQPVARQNSTIDFWTERAGHGGTLLGRQDLTVLEAWKRHRAAHSKTLPDCAAEKTHFNKFLRDAVEVMHIERGSPRSVDGERVGSGDGDDADDAPAPRSAEGETEEKTAAMREALVLVKALALAQVERCLNLPEFHPHNWVLGFSPLSLLLDGVPALTGQNGVADAALLQGVARHDVFEEAGEKSEHFPSWFVPELLREDIAALWKWPPLPMDVAVDGDGDGEQQGVEILSS